MSRALYTAQHCPLTLAQLRTLDIPVNDFYKRVTENMRSFPNEVLYAPILTYAGLGCKRFSSTVNKRKKAVFHRNTLRKGPHSMAANSLAHRAHRNALIPTAHL